MISATDNKLVEIQKGKEVDSSGNDEERLTEEAHSRYLINILKLASSFLLGSKRLVF